MVALFDEQDRTSVYKSIQLTLRTLLSKMALLLALVLILVLFPYFPVANKAKPQVLEILNHFIDLEKLSLNH